MAGRDVGEIQKDAVGANVDREAQAFAEFFIYPLYSFFKYATSDGIASAIESKQSA